MSGIGQSVDFANAALLGRRDFLDYGVSPARIQVYGAPRVVDGDMPVGPMLVQLELVKPSGTVANGVLTLTSAGEAIVDNDGDAVWARVINGDNAWCFDCDVGLTNSQAQLKLSNTALVAGSKVTLVSAVMR